MTEAKPLSPSQVKSRKFDPLRRLDSLQRGLLYKSIIPRINEILESNMDLDSDDPEPIQIHTRDFDFCESIDGVSTVFTPELMEAVRYLYAGRAARDDDDDIFRHAVASVARERGDKKNWQVVVNTNRVIDARGRACRVLHPSAEGLLWTFD